MSGKKGCGCGTVGWMIAGAGLLLLCCVTSCFLFMGYGLRNANPSKLRPVLSKAINQCQDVQKVGTLPITLEDWPSFTGMNFQENNGHGVATVPWWGTDQMGNRIFFLVKMEHEPHQPWHINSLSAGPSPSELQGLGCP